MNPEHDEGMVVFLKFRVGNISGILETSEQGNAGLPKKVPKEKPLIVLEGHVELIFVPVRLRLHLRLKALNQRIDLKGKTLPHRNQDRHLVIDGDACCPFPGDDRHPIPELPARFPLLQKPLKVQRKRGEGFLSGVPGPLS